MTIKNASQKDSGRRLLVVRQLLTQTEGLNQRTIARDVGVVKVLQHLAATADELRQRAGSAIVLVVLLQVLRQVLDAIGEQSNLALC